MEIIISNKSPTPIYEQITSQIKAQIMSGRLKAGSSLPSMRNLAKSLHISVITVQRAYEDLQKDGFIESRVGLGTFVADQNTEIIKEEKFKEIENYLEKSVKLAQSFDISLEELVNILTLFYEGEE